MTWGLGLCPNFPFFLFCAAAGGARKEADEGAHWLRSPGRDIYVYLSDVETELASNTFRISQGTGAEERGRRRHRPGKALIRKYWSLPPMSRR